MAERCGNCGRRHTRRGMPFDCWKKAVKALAQAEHASVHTIVHAALDAKPSLPLTGEIPREDALGGTC